MAKNEQTIPSYSIAKTQLTGIIRCIQDYTNNPSILEICRGLERSLRLQDYEETIYFANEISNWYSENIDSINSNSYANYKKAHQKNHALLPAIIHALKSNADWFEKQESDSLIRSKQKMIFISHSSLDSEYVGHLVNLLRKLGFDSSKLFCSSYPGFGIPLGKDIYDFLKHCFSDYELFVLYAISKEHYYNSPAALNEMGAAWVRGIKSIPILLPEMAPGELRGVVHSGELALVLDAPDAKYRMNELKNELLTFFDVEQIEESAWEKDRDDFIETCLTVVPKEVDADLDGNSSSSNILDDLIEESVSLEKSLYRALRAAKESGNDSLTSWIRKELNGYDSDDELPEYRKTSSKHFTYTGFNGRTQVTNAPLPLGFISKDIMDKVAPISFRDGIKLVETFVRDDSDTATLDVTYLAGEVSKNSDGGISCMSILQKVPKSFFVGIYSEVKNQLMEELTP